MKRTIKCAALLLALVLLCAGCGKKQPAQPDQYGLAPEPSKLDGVAIGNDLEIVSTGRYAGLFVEDGSDETVSDVFCIRVKNTGSTGVQYAHITLYGASDAAYERLCGRPMFDRVTENIRALRELGVGVKLNVSMTPYNVADMAEIYRIAQELGTPMQLATYMFPPIRRDEALVGSNDRFTACQAADAADLAAALRAEYDVDEPTALQDAQAFLDALRQLNIV